MKQGADASIPRSRLPGVAWPAVVDEATARLLAVQYQLAQSQWWPIEQLWAHQRRQLGALVRHALASVPYYRGRLPSGLLDAEGRLDAEGWREVPILSREAVQQAGAALTSGFVPTSHGRMIVSRTSGSTGRPIEVRGTEAASLMANAITLRDHLWHRRELAGKLAVIRVFDFDVPSGGAVSPGWGAATDGYATGPSVALSIHTDLAAQVEWLVREAPDYLLTYPSNVLALAEQFEAGGLQLPSLREVRTVSETLVPGVREACRRVWNVPVVDMYSAQELGYVALQCPEGEQYHLQAEAVLTEIVDEDGHACAPGEVGRVVLTPLHNFATVLLRYEIGDYAEAGAPCPCGRGLPVINRVLGRYRNLAVLPDGRRYWPRLGQAMVRGVAPIRQMQVVQRSLELFDFRYVADREVTEAEQDGLSRILTENVGFPFRVAFTRLDAIPRGRGGKFEDFICEVPPRAQ